MGYGIEQRFFKIQVANDEYYLKSSTPLFIGKCKLKLPENSISPQKEFPLSGKQMITNEGIMRGKRTLTNIWWEYKFVLSLWKPGWGYQKLKIDLLYDYTTTPTIPCLSIYPKYSILHIRDFFLHIHVHMS